VVIRFWDKAATKDGDGAYTCGILIGRTKNAHEVPRFWILDVIRGRWDTHTREKIIRQTVEMDDAVYGFTLTTGMEQEPGSGGKDSAEHTIRNLAGFKVYAERPTGDKFERAVPFSDQVNAGNVGIKKAEWNGAYVEEMKYFGPTCKYKDQIDGTSGGFNKLARKRIHIGCGGYLWMIVSVGLSLFQSGVI
jgi:predicted phage terminase large subunit-like protein